MKFAHELKEVLRREGFPSHWVDTAIPYALLKKSIKKVEAELRSFGLDVETLRRLVPSSSGSDIQNMRRGSGDAAVAFKYQFDEDPTVFRPTLILYVQLENGMAIDASLSINTRNYLASLANRQRQLLGFPASLKDQCEGGLSKDSSPTRLSDGGTSSLIIKEEAPMVQQLEVPLTFDAEFFETLHSDVTILDTLQAKEQKAMTEEIRNLGKAIAKLTNPSKHSKSDLERWRELFDTYLQAGIFFSTNELDHGSRNSIVAWKQLQWFQAEVMKKGLVKSFKIPASLEAFNIFIHLNLTLLRNIKFQEINQLAISKILKKFDKRTSLGAQNTFPLLIQSDKIMSETMAKAVCSEVSNEIVKIVPQLDDYLCPVCFSISYKPVRLTCSHVFCIRCMIRMQKTQDKYCPLCRNDVIMHADSANIDTSLMRFLQKYFPRETKIKQKENEIAAGVDLYGESYADARCIIM